MKERSERLLLPKMPARQRAIDRLLTIVMNLPRGKMYLVTIEEKRRGRSLEQNAYLWGVCYPTILEAGKEELRGWEAEELHEFFLGECYGWKRLRLGGESAYIPRRRSSRLSVGEFKDYIDFVQRRAAGFGIVIPDPVTEERTT
jgi:hypothetical protein